VSKPCIATIGAIDSSGGAGINQDIRVAALFGRQLLCCVGAITIQDSQGLQAVSLVQKSSFASSLGQILNSTDICFVKIGALCAHEQIDMLCSALEYKPHFQIILDPVIAPTAGATFVRKEGLSRLKQLLQKVDFITPNLPELQSLTGIEVSGFEQGIHAAEVLQAETGATILLKGGHLKSATLQEAIVSPEETRFFSHPAHIWHYSHGTGCAFATAFCCFLAEGIAPANAFEKASSWLCDFYDTLNS
jgi:hydroxymethylpyrimidine kinase/phosphomethylpyrimidine kinase